MTPLNDIGGQDPGDLVLRRREAALNMRQPTLAIVVSIACMIVASMIEIVIAARLTEGAARSGAALTAAAPPPTGTIGSVEG